MSQAERGSVRVSVSVVVPTYNRRDSLLRCVGSISHDVQVVVVDDGSTDGTEQALKELGLPNLVYLRQTNKGPASAALEEVGGFDERIRGPGGEDPALSAKVRDKGHRLAYAPTAIVRHDYREGLIDFVRTFYRYGRGCAHVVG